MYMCIKTAFVGCNDVVLLSWLLAAGEFRFSILRHLDANSVGRASFTQRERERERESKRKRERERESLQSISSCKSGAV